MDDEPDIGSAAQLNALAEVLGNSLGSAKEELERGGNPGNIQIKDYLLGCVSVIATIREIARILAQGTNPYAESDPEEITKVLHEMVEGMKERP